MSRWGGIKVYAADKWFSMAIRLAADNRCERCSKEATECAHIFSRQDFSVRWSTYNALAFCSACHDITGKNPIDFHEWIVATYGQERIDRLHFTRRGILKARGNSKQAKDTRALIAAHYREEFRRMQKTGERNLESWN